MRQIIGGLLLAGAMIALGIPQARAIPFTYEYTGNPYDFAIGAYTTADLVSGQFTVDLPSNTSLPFADYSGSVTAFSFSDGVQTLTSADAPFGALIFAFDTDPVGDIGNWAVLVGKNIVTFLGTASLGPLAVDGGTSNLAFGINFHNPGDWQQVSVYEPASLALFAFGLAALILVGWRRRRAGARSATH